MQRFVSPPIADLNRLRQPLTPGERLVFDFFNAHLPQEWEIYLQPHLNGLRPDFVLLHPRVGIAVFEVKDWDLDAMDYWIIGRDGKRPALMARRNGRTFKIQDQNPVDKILLYKKELHDIYCPRLAKRTGFAAVTAGIIFPFANDKRVFDLLKPSLDFHQMSSYPQYNPVSGAEALQSGDLARVFPESARRSSRVMNEDLAKDVRNWLVEPDSAASQRRPLELDENQRALIRTRTASGYRRIRGPAGSGKSLVLAARAAELLGEGREVLVVTFNITLLHYLMDVSVRWRSDVGRTRSDVTWLNFHYWCKRVCEITDHTEEYDELWRHQGTEASSPNSLGRRNVRETLTRELPNLVGKIIEEDDERLVPRYDAVLVDEGQDFLPAWWNALRKVCKPDGEMLLVADATQDVYETARSWTDDAMKGAGFRGGWSELKLSYRLPPQALQLARNFAESFLPADTIDVPRQPQEDLDLYPCKLRWVQTESELAPEVCMEEILRMAPRAEPTVLSISDITFLTGSQKFGLQVVTRVGQKGIRSVHTFDEDTRESRRKKMGFYMGDARVKATTLHSFKGWEARALVIYTGEVIDTKTLAAIYTGLTRIKRHPEGSFLTVVCAAPELADYGKTWPEFDSGPGSVEKVS